MSQYEKLYELIIGTEKITGLFTMRSASEMLMEFFEDEMVSVILDQVDHHSFDGELLRLSEEGSKPILQFRLRFTGMEVATHAAFDLHAHQQMRRVG